MINDEVLDVLVCPTCRTGDLTVGGGRRREVHCDDCGESYPVIDGIVDLVPKGHSQEPGSYRTDTLLDAVARIYDGVAPVMSVGVWRCSPFKFLDSENRALGRGNGGVFLEAPIGTGSILNRCLAPYHDLTVLGVDSSWNMLRKAQRRLSDSSHNIQLLRVDFGCLPIKTGAVRSVQSLNGLHRIADRRMALQEFQRVIESGGFMSGATLIRGNEPLADALLDRFEHYGVFPMLRRSDYLLEEMRNVGLDDLDYSTHGAVLFFSAENLD